MEKVLRDYEMQMHEEYKYSYIDSLKFWHFPIFKFLFCKLCSLSTCSYDSVFDTSTE